MVLPRFRGRGTLEVEPNRPVQLAQRAERRRGLLGVSWGGPDHYRGQLVQAGLAGRHRIGTSLVIPGKRHQVLGQDRRAPLAVAPGYVHEERGHVGDDDFLGLAAGAVQHRAAHEAAGFLHGS